MSSSEVEMRLRREADERGARYYEDRLHHAWNAEERQGEETERSYADCDARKEEEELARANESRCGATLPTRGVASK